MITVITVKSIVVLLYLSLGLLILLHFVGMTLLSNVTNDISAILFVLNHLTDLLELLEHDLLKLLVRLLVSLGLLHEPLDLRVHQLKYKN